ncbi:MAG TPA: UDP-glucose/GDP-mannose dehydrogenase family protein, partial [Patescibacteria group bacterium]|nr:UDP-glucose/GDP-mannose dehydrogenase family protein [Patescibacteria group bacterium]
MNLTIIGTGYVGLVTGVCFAENGNQVTCVDVNEDKISMLKKGQSPIYEPGLDKLLNKNIKDNSITFTTNLKGALEDTEIIFLCLPTPPGEDGSADLSYVLGVAKELSSLIKDGTIIVNKSTVPVGTAKKIKDVISHNTDVKFEVVSNPEFLKEGFAVEDFMKPDRVVIGTDSKTVSNVMTKLYKPFVSSNDQIIIMDIPSAEMTKYAANSFLATKITFINEIANLCEKVGADVDSVRVGIGSDERIGKKFLYAGIGYGGSCFPKDVQALQKTAHEYASPINILEAVSVANDNQKSVLISKIRSYFGDL